MTNRFAPLADRDPAERLGVTALIGREAGRGASLRTPGAAASAGDERQALTGRLVHRLLQSGDRSGGTAGLAGFARALLRRDELAGVDDLREAVERACQVYETIRADPEFAAVPPDACLFEVPFSLRRAGERVILRGAIDCLARTGEGRLTVFEFKTGRPSPEHRAQLEIYLSAVRAMLPGTTVDGRLLYREGGKRGRESFS